MNTETIEVIRELGQTSCWEKASVIIAGISTFLTLVVLWYNHKSIKLTQQTIKLTQQTMRQAINLQLYEKRLTLYSGLSRDDAFVDAPLELKIVFSMEIYNQYKELVDLCEKQRKTFESFTNEYKGRSQYDCKGYETSENAYNRMIEAIQSASRTNVNTANCVKKYKKELEEVHKRIAENIKKIDDDMKKVIEDSIS